MGLPATHLRPKGKRNKCCPHISGPRGGLPLMVRHAGRTPWWPRGQDPSCAQQGDTGPHPGPGGPHALRSNGARAPRAPRAPSALSPATAELTSSSHCTLAPTAPEAHALRSPRPSAREAATERSPQSNGGRPCSLHPEEAQVQQ